MDGGITPTGMLERWSHRTLKTALIMRWQGQRCPTTPVFQHPTFVAHQSRIPSQTPASAQRSLWLFSRRVDFWLASAGASAAIAAAVLVVLWHGDREIDALDFVLSELHLGATYHAVIRRRLWHRLPLDVLVVPLVILAITYALSMSGQAVLLTSIAMYAAVWHRGRQSLGLARFYQRAVGGPASPLHDRLFQSAVYLPMVAALLSYAHLAPLEYEGQPYWALNLGAEVAVVAVIAAASWLIAYFAWALWRNHAERLITAPHSSGIRVHPGERWVVLAHAVAFGSGYVLGASNASFLLVLAVHHEVQYLYFAYAMSRRSAIVSGASKHETDRATRHSYSTALSREDDVRFELKHAASFLVWPVIGFVGAVVGGWWELEWLAPLGLGGLFCHYWLDGRIWTRRAMYT
jgi:hypothetical protein